MNKYFDRKSWAIKQFDNFTNIQKYLQMDFMKNKPRNEETAKLLLPFNFPIR